MVKKKSSRVSLFLIDCGWFSFGCDDEEKTLAPSLGRFWKF